MVERKKGKANESSVLSCKFNRGWENLTFALPSGKSMKRGNPGLVGHKQRDREIEKEYQIAGEDREKAKEKEIERAGKDGEIEEEQGITYAGGKGGSTIGGKGHWRKNIDETKKGGNGQPEKKTLMKGIEE